MRLLSKAIFPASRNLFNARRILAERIRRVPLMAASRQKSLLRIDRIRFILALNFSLPFDE